MTQPLRTQRRTSCLSLALLALSTFACAPPAPDDGEAEPEELAFAAPGYLKTTEIGTIADTTMMSRCDIGYFVMNADRSAYFSPTGVDGTWQSALRMPSTGVRSIFCGYNGAFGFVRPDGRAYLSSLFLVQDGKAPFREFTVPANTQNVFVGPPDNNGSRWWAYTRDGNLFSNPDPLTTKSWRFVAKVDQPFVEVRAGVDWIWGRTDRNGIWRSDSGRGWYNLGTVHDFEPGVSIDGDKENPDRIHILSRHNGKLSVSDVHYFQLGHDIDE